jgi:hypothetical protein
MKIVISIVTLLVICLMMSKKEAFTTYTQYPFKYQKIGTSPLNYYPKPRYRLPYRYPYTFHSSYPTNHATFF